MTDRKVNLQLIMQAPAKQQMAFKGSRTIFPSKVFMPDESAFMSWVNRDINSAVPSLLK